MKYVGLIGMSLVLVSACLQLFVDTGATIEADAKRYRLEKKVDTVWSVLADLYSHSPVNQSTLLNNSNFEWQWKNYEWATDELETVELKAQIRVLWGWKLALFIIGSVLLIIGKYRGISQSGTKEQRA